MHITTRTHSILSNRAPQTTTHPFEIPDGNHPFEDLVAYTKNTGEHVTKQARAHADDAFITGTMTGGAYGVLGMGFAMNNLDIVLLGAQCLAYSAGVSLVLEALQKKKFPTRINVFFKFTRECVRMANKAHNKATQITEWLQENEAALTADTENATPIRPITGARPA